VSARGPRKRPRKTSFRLRPLFAVVTREAVIRICFAHVLNHLQDSDVRRFVVRRRLDGLRREAARLLDREPRRRFWPREVSPTAEAAPRASLATPWAAPV